MESVAAETWKAIPGFEGKYEVSDFGRVKSLDRIVTRVCRWGVKDFRWKGRIMTPTDHKGWLVVKLGACKKMWGVHQLVAMAFIGPCPAGLVVDHVDTNKHNNVPSNLEYVTDVENTKRQYKTGLLDNRGETNGKAVLNDELVRRIREYPKSIPAKKVAAELGLKPHNVSQVRNGRWAHVAVT